MQWKDLKMQWNEIPLELSNLNTTNYKQYPIFKISNPKQAIIEQQICKQQNNEKLTKLNVVKGAKDNAQVVIDSVKIENE